MLELRGCSLKRMNPQTYHFLPYLSHLDLGDNQFPYLDAEEFRDLHRLHNLKLDGNKLPVILDRTFGRQTQLKYLCLARNRLAKITDNAFLNLSSLVELDISYNKLKIIESSVLKFVSDTVQRLVISGNYFTLDIIKSVVQSLTRLWHLEIAHSRLTEVPENFLPERIKRLNISFNNISQISSDAIPNELTELDLSHNQLRGLNDSVIVKLKSFKFVDLSDNPWSCTLCHVTSILYYVNKTSIFKGLKCASPITLKNRELTTLRLEDMTNCNSFEEEDLPNHNFSLLIGAICIVILAILSILFVVISCVRRHQQNRSRQQKRYVDNAENNLQNATAIFSKDEIRFKFPLDLTERRMSVSTIDEIKRDAVAGLSNGSIGTGI